ncbi:MAG TPA: phosphoenolpyruvate--protein phosphotransferase [Planctomycetaceae bacterium]|nr:phosphoenolpyruvate--protein phosphotransferase [Planctomycetaceae bacterium]
MELNRGIAVAPGVAIGPALVLGSEDFRIPQRFVRVDAIDSEVGRFHAALDAAVSEITGHEALASSRLGQQYGAIFAAHRQLAQDPKLIREIEDLIRQKCHSPEFAASRVLRQHARALQNLGDRYFAERATDLFDLEKRILRHLLGERREELMQLTAPVIVLAHNLTPSETANLDTQFVLGFATEVGGKSSHTAILAGALELPAVVGVGSFLSDVSGGETIIIDGNQGIVVIGPDAETLGKYRAEEQKMKTTAVRLRSLSPLQSETRDGVAIQLYGNIEFPHEVEHCTQRGAAGIGLYRTEFLYLENDQAPTEEVQYEVYAEVVRAFAGKPVVIRTLDLGAEKFPQSMQEVIEATPNPTLGLRSLRLTLQNLPLFKTQLRAILRAALLGDVRVMFPLVSTLLELRQAKMILADVIEDLEEQGVPFNPKVQVGMMVEVPSAALMADEFAREVDFFSIGTNDLIQYTLAVDRANPAVANLYSSADPSIFRMIRMVLSAAEKHEVSVSVCGQMSSDPIYTPLLVGMGLRELSVTPQAIPEIKQAVRCLTVPQAREIAEHAQTLEVARDVENYLRGELKKLCPDLV